MNKEKLKSGLVWFFKSFIWLGILLLVADLVSKSLIVANKDYINKMVAENGKGIILIPNFLSINYVINTGAAFGLGTGNSLVNRIVYICFAALVCIAILFFFIKKYDKLGKMYKATMMMILVGAIGNMIDRLAYMPAYLGVGTYDQTGVVDWIYFFTIWKVSFNIADCCIVIGVILLVIWLIVEEVRDNKKAKKVQLAKEAEEATLVVTEETKAEESKKENKPSDDERFIEKPIKKVSKSKAKKK